MKAIALALLLLAGCHTTSVTIPANSQAPQQFALSDRRAEHCPTQADAMEHATTREEVIEVMQAWVECDRRAWEATQPFMPYLSDRMSDR